MWNLGREYSKYWVLPVLRQEWGAFPGYGQKIVDLSRNTSLRNPVPSSVDGNIKLYPHTPQVDRCRTCFRTSGLGGNNEFNPSSCSRFCSIRDHHYLCWLVRFPSSTPHPYQRQRLDCVNAKRKLAVSKKTITNCWLGNEIADAQSETDQMIVAVIDR